MSRPWASSVWQYAYPTPDELWKMTFAKTSAWRDRFAAVSYPDKSGTWSLRFYQEISVNRVLPVKVTVSLAVGAFAAAEKLTCCAVSDTRVKLVGDKKTPIGGPVSAIPRAEEPR
jgi:hypothetical protein